MLADVEARGADALAAARAEHEAALARHLSFMVGHAHTCIKVANTSSLSIPSPNIMTMVPHSCILKEVASLTRHALTLPSQDRLLADKDELNRKCATMSEALRASEERQERALSKMKEGVAQVADVHCQLCVFWFVCGHGVGWLFSRLAALYCLVLAWNKRMCPSRQRAAAHKQMTLLSALTEMRFLCSYPLILPCMFIPYMPHGRHLCTLMGGC